MSFASNVAEFTTFDIAFQYNRLKLENQITSGGTEDPYYNESNFSLSVNVETALIGDVNFDNVINIVDVVALVGHILGTSPLTSIFQADTNDDGILNVVDVVALVEIILN